MAGILRYMSELNKALKNDYSRDGIYGESCTEVAFDIAEKLLLEGRKPEIFLISEDVSESGMVHPKKLSPLPYSGRVNWYAHVVCCAEGLVFDPILETPIPVEYYCTTAFGENVKMKKKFSTDAIRAHIFNELVNAHMNCGI